MCLPKLMSPGRQDRLASELTQFLTVFSSSSITVLYVYRESLPMGLGKSKEGVAQMGETFFFRWKSSTFPERWLTSETLSMT